MEAAKIDVTKKKRGKSRRVLDENLAVIKEVKEDTSSDDDDSPKQKE